MDYLKSKKSKIFLGILLFLVLIFSVIIFWQERLKEGEKGKDDQIMVETKGDDYWEDETKLKALLPVDEVIPPPPPPNMERMKSHGCVADGLLNGYVDGTGGLLKMVNRSKCYYLHRSIETWLQAPDFEEIKKNMTQIEKKDVVYGMFIAEAISTKTKYYYEAGERELDFDKMCRPGTKNDWGEHTCKPSLAKKEYQRYVLDVTRQAMDLGVQSFMFGQVFYQDYISDPSIGIVLEKMRRYAKLRGMEIVIGAQTNDIEDESYLRQFDFIEGGVGLSHDGVIEDGPCYSRWWKKEGDWCWALLWHERFKNKANNVFAHLDWSGKVGDDMSTFSLMTKEERANALRYLDNYFAQKDVGFLMPMAAVLPKENGGCYGKSKDFYSADNKYSCDDEDIINSLLGE